MNPITSFLGIVLALAGAAVGYWSNPYLAMVFFAAAAIIASSLKIADALQTFVILRMGKLQSAKAAGVFAIIPILDTARHHRPEFPQNRNLNDNERRQTAVALNARFTRIPVAVYTLSEMIGSSMLAALLYDRKDADERLTEGGIQSGFRPPQKNGTIGNDTDGAVREWRENTILPKVTVRVLDAFWVDLCQYACDKFQV